MFMMFIYLLEEGSKMVDMPQSFSFKVSRNSSSTWKIRKNQLVVIKFLVVSL